MFVCCNDSILNTSCNVIIFSLAYEFNVAQYWWITMTESLPAQGWWNSTLSRMALELLMVIGTPSLSVWQVSHTISTKLGKYISTGTLIISTMKTQTVHLWLIQTNLIGISLYVWGRDSWHICVQLMPIIII